MPDGRDVPASFRTGDKGNRDRQCIFADSQLVLVEKYNPGAKRQRRGWLLPKLPSFTSGKPCPGTPRLLGLLGCGTFGLRTSSYFALLRGADIVTGLLSRGRSSLCTALRGICRLLSLLRGHIGLVGSLACCLCGC